MERHTTILQAIERWKLDHIETPYIHLAKEVNFSGQWWPIKYMDDNLALLENCEKLYLDSNKIEKIEGLEFMPKLTFLSLELNQVKSIKGLMPVANTLKVLRINCNLISSLKGIQEFDKLEELQIKNNCISGWEDFYDLMTCANLTKLSMTGNHFNKTLPKDVWIYLASRRNPRLKLIDGVMITETFPEGYYPHTLLECCDLDEFSPYMDPPPSSGDFSSSTILDAVAIGKLIEKSEEELENGEEESEYGEEESEKSDNYMFTCCDSTNFEDNDNNYNDNNDYDYKYDDNDNKDYDNNEYDYDFDAYDYDDYDYDEYDYNYFNNYNYNEYDYFDDDYDNDDYNDQIDEAY